MNPNISHSRAPRTDLSFDQVLMPGQWSIMVLTVTGGGISRYKNINFSKIK